MHVALKRIASLLLPIFFGCIAGVAGFFAVTRLLHKKPIPPPLHPSIEAVITPSAFRRISPAPNISSIKWNTYTDKKLGFTLKYPDNVIIDERQTIEDRITVFIFEDDRVATLPGKVTALYVADTHEKTADGYSAFRTDDCGAKCDISYKKVDWVNVNNVYGIRNPLPEDVANYYVTDKQQRGTVVNLYVGGYLGKEEAVESKTAAFEEIVKTISFSR